MTGADLLSTAPRKAKHLRGLNIVTLDIERIPGRFAANFWDMNSYKGRRISVEDVVSWPRTICLAWRWYGQRKVDFSSEWGDGYEEMHRLAWEVYDRADVVVGHNLKNFDTKHLATGWRDLGMAPPRPFKTVDTLLEARKVFGDESKQLIALTQRLGIDTKTDKYDPRVAQAALDGDAKAQRRLALYNRGDVVATEGLYDALRPWMRSHPFVGSFTNLMRCPNCNSDNLQSQGTTRAVVLDYPLYRCGDCGANVKATRHAGRVANTRGI